MGDWSQPGSEFVTCSACGARIRSDRSTCLRCGEALATPPGGARNDAGIQRSNGGVIAGVIAALGAVAALAYFTQPAKTDDRARPVVTSRSSSMPSASASGEADAATTAIASVPEPVTALDFSRSGKAALSAGELETARARYEQALAQHADDPDVLNDLGLILMRQNQVPDAIARFTRASQLSPEKWAYRFNLAQAFGQTGEWGRAIAEYRTAAGLFPDDYATQYNLALAMHKSGDDAAAVPEFEKAIALAPSEATFHVGLGVTLERMGRLPDAEKEYRTYLEMEPSAPDAARLKAHLDELAASRSAPAAPKS